MNKKVISAVLAGAMALSTMGVSAFAADKTIKAAGATTYKVTGTLAAPEINVTLPGTVGAVINPYGVSFQMKGETYGAQGVTSPLYTIKNNTTASAVAVNVTATLTVPTTGTGDAKAPSIVVAKKDTEIATNEKPATAKKTVYAVVAGAAAKTNVDVGDEAPALDLLGETPVDNVTTAVFEDATMDAKGATHTVTTLMVIPKGTEAKAETSEGAGDAVKATYGYGQFQLGGDVTDTKVTPWVSSDKLTINLVLDIGPAADPE